jgi:hypothetical protein
VQLSKRKILETLNDEVTLFSDRLVGTGAGTIIGGIHLIYLQENISGLSKLMGYPKVLLKLLHGCYNHGSRSFEDVDREYGKLLETVAVDEKRTDIGLVQKEQTEKFLLDLERSKARLIENTEKWGRGMLDHYRLPHPLLGKITARETLYVTILEVQYRRRLLM